MSLAHDTTSPAAPTGAAAAAVFPATAPKNGSAFLNALEYSLQQAASALAATSGSGPAHSRSAAESSAAPCTTMLAVPPTAVRTAANPAPVPGASTIPQPAAPPLIPSIPFANAPTPNLRTQQNAPVPESSAPVGRSRPGATAKAQAAESAPPVAGAPSLAGGEAAVPVPSTWAAPAAPSGTLADAEAGNSSAVTGSTPDPPPDGTGAPDFLSAAADARNSAGKPVPLSAPPSADIRPALRAASSASESPRESTSLPQPGVFAAAATSGTTGAPSISRSAPMADSGNEATGEPAATPVTSAGSVPPQSAAVAPVSSAIAADSAFPAATIGVAPGAPGAADAATVAAAATAGPVPAWMPAVTAAPESESAVPAGAIASPDPATLVGSNPAPMGPAAPRPSPPNALRGSGPLLSAARVSFAPRTGTVPAQPQSAVSAGRAGDSGPVPPSPSRDGQESSFLNHPVPGKNPGPSLIVPPASPTPPAAANPSPAANTGPNVAPAPAADSRAEQPPFSNGMSADGTLDATAPSPLSATRAALEPETDADQTLLEAVSEKPLAATPVSPEAALPGGAALAPAATAMAAAIPGQALGQNIPAGNGTIAAAPASADEPAAGETTGRLPAGETPELSAALQAWNGGDNPQAAAAQSAHLLGRLGATEMNIALQGEALGTVQVRAHLSGDQVGASIAVERHDVHALLASDLPSLHQGLTERQLRLESVSVFQGSFPAGSGTSGHGPQGQLPGGTQQQPGPAGAATADFPGGTENSFLGDSPETRTVFNSDGRLSVRA